jgi:hypothetical protein
MPTILEYLNGLRPALPLSSERHGERGEKMPMSNSELRRCLEQKAVLLNGERDWAINEEAPAYVWQLVFYPKSVKAKPGTLYAKRTTIV